jgi:hypothetical protein
MHWSIKQRENYFRNFSSNKRTPQTATPHINDTPKTTSARVAGFSEFRIALNENAKINTGAKMSALHVGNFIGLFRSFFLIVRSVFR